MKNTNKIAFRQQRVTATEVERQEKIKRKGRIASSQISICLRRRFFQSRPPFRHQLLTEQLKNSLRLVSFLVNSSERLSFLSSFFIIQFIILNELNSLAITATVLSTEKE